MFRFTRNKKSEFKLKLPRSTVMKLFLWILKMFLCYYNKYFFCHVTVDFIEVNNKFYLFKKINYRVNFLNLIYSTQYINIFPFISWNSRLQTNTTTVSSYSFFVLLKTYSQSFTKVNIKKNTKHSVLHKNCILRVQN